MKILYVAPEIAPFAKTGGLADVARSLPKALRELGHDVRSIMPKYADAASHGLAISPLKSISVQMQNGKRGALLCKAENGNVPTYFIENNDYFNREGYYGIGDWDYPDNLERFTFFCKATLEACRTVNFLPDIIHCNDWQTAPLPALIKDMANRGSTDAFFNRLPGSVFSIHNISYQGRFPSHQWPLLTLPQDFYTYDFEYYGQINLMKGAIHFSDAVHTVSRTYAHEIQYTEFGFGLQDILQHNSHKLHGILNGADYQEWSPDTDRFTYGIHYTNQDLSGKKRIRENLQKDFNLPHRDDIPLLGLTARFVAQKGIDLVRQCAERILNLDTQLVVLGQGNGEYHQFFEWLHAKYPERVGIYIGFNEALAHKILAGADIFLMPSHFEPCGLSQIYSLKYGTLPVVRLTGGLADTIRDGVNGFTFFDFNAGAFFDSVRRACDTLRFYPDPWRKMVDTAMGQDFSWKKSAEQYIAMYQHTLNTSHSGQAGK